MYWNKEADIDCSWPDEREHTIARTHSIGWEGRGGAKRQKRLVFVMKASASALCYHLKASSLMVIVVHRHFPWPRFRARHTVAVEQNAVSLFATFITESDDEPHYIGRDTYNTDI